jgi:hypothetical protein
MSIEFELQIGSGAGARARLACFLLVIGVTSCATDYGPGPTPPDTGQGGGSTAAGGGSTAAGGGSTAAGGGSTAAGGGSGMSCLATGAVCDLFTNCCGVCTEDAIDSQAVNHCGSLCKQDSDCPNGCCVSLQSPLSLAVTQACMSRRYCPTCGLNHTACTTDDDCCSPFYCLPFSGSKVCMRHCILDTDCTRSDLFSPADGCCRPVPNTTQKACFPPSGCSQVPADAG